MIYIQLDLALEIVRSYEVQKRHPFLLVGKSTPTTTTTTTISTTTTATTTAIEIARTTDAIYDIQPLHHFAVTTTGPPRSHPLPVSHPPPQSLSLPFPLSLSLSIPLSIPLSLSSTKSKHTSPSKSYILLEC